MAAIAAAASLAAAGISSGMQSSAAGRAADAMQSGYAMSRDQFERLMHNQNFLSFLANTQNLQTMQGPVQNQLAANQLLGGMLGIGNLSPGGVGPGGSVSGVSLPGGGAGGPSIGGVPLTPGATPTTAGSSPFLQNQVTLPSGQIITLPAGYDLSSIYGPRAATPLNLTSEQAGTLQGGLLSTGVSAGDIQNYLGGSLGIMEDKGKAAIEAEALRSGTFGGGGMGTDLMSFLSGLYGEYAPTQAFQMKQTDLNRIFSTLQNYATGAPGAITSSAGSNLSGTGMTTGQMGQTGTNIAQSMLGGQFAGAQGTLGQANAWSGGINNIASILAKYAQNQPQGTNQFSSPYVSGGSFPSTVGVEDYNQYYGYTP